jgi:molybdenum ABC transporter molybdate-binding protein
MPTTRSNNTGERPDWEAGWSVGVRAWVEHAGQAVLGSDQLQLLEAIDRQRSISAAARALGIPYRRAWELVQGMNAAAGEPLVTTATGGVHGGGAQLTPRGSWVMAAFRQAQGKLQQTAADLVPHCIEPATPTLHVLAAVSLEEVLGQLLTDFAAIEPGLRVRALFGASDELADHLLAGAPGQLFLTADPHPLDRLAAARLLLPGTTVLLAENGLAAVANSDRDCPVCKPTDLAGDDGLRVALAGPDCPLGRYTAAYLTGLNLYERVLRRAIRVENSRAVLAAVRAGQADIGLVYSSDAAHAERCCTLFRARRAPFPIQYCGTLLNRGADPGPARRLLEFLGSSRATPRFRQCGFLPTQTPA